MERKLDTPKGAIYQRGLGSATRTMTRGFVPEYAIGWYLHELPKQTSDVERENHVAKITSQTVARLFTEGGIITSSGVVIGFGDDNFYTLPRDYRERLRTMGIAKGYMSQLRDIPALHINPERQNYGKRARAYVIGQDFLSRINVVRHRQNSVSFQVRAEGQPTFFLDGLERAVEEFVKKGLQDAEVAGPRFPAMTLARAAFMDACAVLVEKTPRITAA